MERLGYRILNTDPLIIISPVGQTLKWDDEKKDWIRVNNVRR